MGASAVSKVLVLPRRAWLRSTWKRSTTATPASESATGPVGDTTASAAGESATGPGGDAAAEAAGESVTGPGGDAAAVAASEIATGPVGDAAAETASGIATGPVGDATARAAGESATGPVGDTAAKAASESAAGPVGDATAKAVSDVTAESGSENATGLVSDAAASATTCVGHVSVPSSAAALRDARPGGQRSVPSRCPCLRAGFPRVGRAVSRVSRGATIAGGLATSPWLALRPSARRFDDPRARHGGLMPGRVCNSARHILRQVRRPSCHCRPRRRFRHRRASCAGDHMILRAAQTSSAGIARP